MDRRRDGVGGDRVDRHSAMSGWIGVDLDGTLAEYHKDPKGGPIDLSSIGKPIPLMVGRVKAWLAEGKDVRIMTARLTGETYAERMRGRLAVRAWCRQHIGQDLPITDRKDYQMIELWDNRAVSVESNTGRAFSFRFGFDPNFGHPLR